MHGQALGNLMEFGRVGLVSCHEIRGLTNATGGNTVYCSFWPLIASVCLYVCTSSNNRNE